MALNRNYIDVLNCITNRITKKSSYPSIYQIEKERFFYWIVNSIFLSVEYGQITTERNLDCISSIKQVPAYPTDKVLLSECKFYINSLFRSCVDKKDFFKIMHEVADEISSLPNFHVECVTPGEENSVKLAKMTISFIK